MSAKGGRRNSRKATSESIEDSKNHVAEDSADSSKLNGSNPENDEKEMKGFSESEINGTKLKNDELVKEIAESEEFKQESQSESESSQKNTPEEKQVNGVEEAVNGEDVTEQNGVRNEAEIEHDEPEPELQFDENSDIESVKNASPVVSRCTTRRSHVRNVPTPKTPKLIVQEQIDEEPPSQESEENNEEEPHAGENGKYLIIHYLLISITKNNTKNPNITVVYFTIVVLKLLCVKNDDSRKIYKNIKALPTTGPLCVYWSNEFITVFSQF